ncbi:imm11 family protein [Vibrio sp. LaRot3]|uniref:imm11 family protein n=1 Tax=Vibrio sp. LaRot3 TaxID=2998829 RepID=UPI0022CDEE6A|nr:hypothetical protein [Vibrio sp. LaRot3]MDA0147410.1 hypothetical protein [Vibrio sp. LaRot3]
MSYNNNYYIMHGNYSDNTEPWQVIPTEQTALRRFHFRKLNLEDGAVHFNAKSRLALSETSNLFCTPSLLFTESFKAQLEQHIYGGQLFPATVEYKGENTQQPFLLLNMYQDLDCWDRETSDYKECDDEDDEPRVYQYRLDANVLDKIDEDQRLIFKMGGCDLSPLFIHEKLKQQIEPLAPNLRFIRVSDYQFGDEYEDE